MENFINSVGIEKIILFVLIFNVVLLIGFIINIIKTNAISKKYKNFMQKLGEGKNIEEDLENYMYKVERVEKQNIEIIKTKIIFFINIPFQIFKIMIVNSKN